MNYYQHSTRRIELGGEDLILYSKPGMVDWEDVVAATTLLAEDTPIESGMHVLILEGGAGALGVVAARKGAQVDLCNDNIIAARMAHLTFEANNVKVNMIDSTIPSQDATYDLALMVNPKGRAFARFLIHAAHKALKPGGRLYFCGANAQGAKAIATDAGEIFETIPITVQTKSHQRLSVVTKGTSESRELPEPDTFTDNGLTFYTMPGVFSREGLDAGTAMLLSTVDTGLCAGKQVLDMGCGYGVIGIQVVKLGAAHVDMADISLLAISCGLMNMMANDLEAYQCRFIPSDLYSDIADDARYDLILSNPPFHAGHSVDTAASEALISGARDHLAKGGVLRIVANRFLAYDKLMHKVFDQVEVVKEDGKFWVLDGRN